MRKDEILDTLRGRTRFDNDFKTFCGWCCSKGIADFHILTAGFKNFVKPLLRAKVTGFSGRIIGNTAAPPDPSESATNPWTAAWLHGMDEDGRDVHDHGHNKITSVREMIGEIKEEREQHNDVRRPISIFYIGGNDPADFDFADRLTANQYDFEGVRGLLLVRTGSRLHVHCRAKHIVFQEWEQWSVVKAYVRAEIQMWTDRAHAEQAMAELAAQAAAQAEAGGY